VAAIAIVVCGGALIAAGAASNSVDSSNLGHITHLPGPPPQTTQPPTSPPASDTLPTDPASSGSLSSDSLSSSPAPSDPAPSSTG
jgi:hypothetical protein